MHNNAFLGEFMQKAISFLFNNMLGFFKAGKGQKNNYINTFTLRNTTDIEMVRRSNLDRQKDRQTEKQLNRILNLVHIAFRTL